MLNLYQISYFFCSRGLNKSTSAQDGDIAESLMLVGEAFKNTLEHDMSQNDKTKQLTFKQNMSIRDELNAPFEDIDLNESNLVDPLSAFQNNSQHLKDDHDDNNKTDAITNHSKTNVFDDTFEESDDNMELDTRIYTSSPRKVWN